ncbi:MAG: VOC family protein [Pseudomonadota bacterium]
MPNDTELAALIGRMSGRFVGDEEIVIDPAEQRTLQATGKFVNSAVLGGTGIRAEYVQEIGGEAGMRCETVFRFDNTGAAVMSWLPSEGDPQVYRGSFDGFVIEASHTSGDGTRQTLTADYSDLSGMSNSMHVHLPDGSKIPVFSGSYRRVPTVQGQQMWRDLTVDDAATVRTFYELVLGWSGQGADMGGYEDFHMLDAEGQVAAGVCHARGGNADLPPVWLPYFAVDSAEGAMRRAEEAGGRAVSALKQHDRYRYIALEDPAGASFIACEEVFG